MVASGQAAPEDLHPPAGDSASGIVSGTGTLEAAVEREANPLKRFLRVLGPGCITGTSDDDPSGIGTDAVPGSLPRG